MLLKTVKIIHKLYTGPTFFFISDYVLDVNAKAYLPNQLHVDADLLSGDTFAKSAIPSSMSDMASLGGWAAKQSPPKQFSKGTC